MRNNDSIQRLGFKVEAKPQKYLSVGVGWEAEGGGRGHDEAEVEEHRSVFANMMNEGGPPNNPSALTTNGVGVVGWRSLSAKGGTQEWKKDPHCKHSKSAANSYLHFSCQSVPHSLTQSLCWACGTLDHVKIHETV